MSKELFTTYFANVKNLPNNVIPISIAGKKPDGFCIEEYKKLAPKWSFFSVWKETHDNDYYIENFQKQVLDKLSPYEVVSDLLKIVGDDSKSIALVCYETPEKFCHRHLVAAWLTKNGFSCNEFHE